MNYHINTKYIYIQSISIIYKLHFVFLSLYCINKQIPEHCAKTEIKFTLLLLQWHKIKLLYTVDVSYCNDIIYLEQVCLATCALMPVYYMQIVYQPYCTQSTNSNVHIYFWAHIETRVVVCWCEHETSAFGTWSWCFYITIHWFHSLCTRIQLSGSFQLYKLLVSNVALRSLLYFNGY